MMGINKWNIKYLVAAIAKLSLVQGVLPCFRRTFFFLVTVMALALLLRREWQSLNGYQRGRQWWWRTSNWMTAVVWQSPYQGRMTKTKMEAILRPGNDNQTKKILLYNRFFDSKDWFGAEAMSSCATKSCSVSFLEDVPAGEAAAAVGAADAVLFHMLNLREWGQGDVRQVNKWRRKHRQKFVLFNMESAVWLSHRIRFSTFDGFFNWTMTFRTDSDVFSPYGQVSNRRERIDSATRGPGPQPSGRRGVLWLVSNCATESQRERYVGELIRSRLVDVDVFGRCGPRKCQDDCFKSIEDKYLFYLSFENSLCQDYVTEKFFKYLDTKLVPIVLGRADYSKLAPNHSYIDARDFPNPVNLAKYLKFLEDNPDEYQRYSWWKQDYDVIPNHGWSSIGLCNLCALLHNETAVSSHSTYDNLWGWMGVSGEGPTCKEKAAVPWANYSPYLSPTAPSPGSRAWGSHSGTTAFFVLLVLAIFFVAVTALSSAAAKHDDDRQWLDRIRTAKQNRQNARTGKA